MDAFPGGPVDLAQLQSTMITIEHAGSSIQMHINPVESEKFLIPLHQSPMPYKLCRFILVVMALFGFSKAAKAIELVLSENTSYVVEGCMLPCMSK